MAPCDFWLFPRLKTPLKDCRFDSSEDILEHDGAATHHSKTSLSELLPAMEGLLG
jgi:hypothetical protein